MEEQLSGQTAVNFYLLNLDILIAQESNNGVYQTTFQHETTVGKINPGKLIQLITFSSM